MTEPDVHAPDPHAAASGLLQGRTVVVTGGANGIGAAVARLCAAHGATGVVLDRTVTRETVVPEGWGALAVDVTDDAAVAEAFAAVDGLLPRIDVVVAAAGIVPRWRPIAELDLDEFDQVMAVNARGVASTIKHAAPRLSADASIVAVASLNSWRGDANLTSYAASKHAVLGIVRSAALSLGKAGVRVNAVAPGPIATEALLARMTARAAGGGLSVEDALAGLAEGTALGRIATPDDVAGTVLFLASGLAGGITGQLLPVDGGII